LQQWFSKSSTEQLTKASNYQDWNAQVFCQAQSNESETVVIQQRFDSLKVKDYAQRIQVPIADAIGNLERLELQPSPR
jgi:hypothetical protein